MTGDKLILLKTEEILPPTDNPRKIYDESELLTLSDSIKRNGLLQPLVVRKTEKGYSLVVGSRRKAALEILGIKEAPCIVIKSNNLETAALGLIENLHRKELNPFEEAEAIEKLLVVYGLSQTEVANMLSLAASTLSNKLRILALNKETREILLKNNLTERHARALLCLKEEKRLSALNIIVTKKLNVKETESLIKKLNSENKKRKSVAVIKDYKIFTNSFLNLVNTMRQNGINAKTAKTETDDFIEYTVRIAKTKTT